MPARSIAAARYPSMAAFEAALEDRAQRRQGRRQLGQRLLAAVGHHAAAEHLAERARQAVLVGGR
ncbi:MAG: hypothetical protein K8M05_17385, partial [Deltaproteobacteria bacterium]|nr:hypothetical protein [Kofleriaceae bacterium]